MKKIICLIESLGSGGAERQMSGLAVLLKKQGYDVEVWTYYPNDFYLPTLQCADVTYRYIAEAQSKKSRVKVLRRELRKANPDTVIAYLDTACMVACIIKALGARFRLIVSERNTTQKLSKRERVKFFLYRFADWIVPNSHTQAEFIKANFPRLANKVKCITNFVDTDKFVPAKDYTPNTPLRILTVARIMPQKNVVGYINAIKRVVDRGYKLYVDWFGNSTDESYFALCKQTIADNKLDDVVVLHPATRNILEEYQKSDIFCLPSYFEGFPNVVCEAMSCGLPILASDVCDNESIVKDGCNGWLFNPNSEEEIAQNIIKSLKSSFQSIIDMRQSSRERAEKVFSDVAFIESYISIV